MFGARTESRIADLTCLSLWPWLSRAAGGPPVSPFFVFMFPALVLLALGISKLQQKNGFLSSKPGKERELLSAIRDSGGNITPTEAALETSLTVKEADRMLSDPSGRTTRGYGWTTATTWITPPTE